jgi:hypothetical protein
MDITSFYRKFPPSQSCNCEICSGYCKRPGWWIVDEAAKAISSGLANRMMLEISPGRSFGVLSPAFKGNEGSYAYNLFSDQGCTFFHEGKCDLYNTEYQPLECRFCHHDRQGLGKQCHFEIEKDWNTPEGKRIIVRWGNVTGFWQRQGLILKGK